jgi:hypothetical protein
MGKYDFFISYKWVRYSEQAKELGNIASSLNYDVWIDIDHPFHGEMGSGLEISLFSEVL